MVWANGKVVPEEAASGAAAWLYAMVLLVYPLVYYITQAETRYRHTIDPQMVILAVCTLVAPRAAASKVSAASAATQIHVSAEESPVARSS